MKIKKISQLCSLFLVLGCSFYGFSEDTKSGEASEKSAVHRFLSEFKKNAQYLMVGHADFFNQSELHKKKTYTDLLLKGSSFGQLTSTTSFHLGAYAAYTQPSGAMRGGLFNPSNRESYRKFFDFIEVYSKTQFSFFDLSLGKILFNNTLSEINSVANIYNGLNVVGFQDPLPVGQWMIRADHYLENEDQFTFAFLPFEMYPTVVSNGASRWYSNFGGYTEPLGYPLSADTTMLDAEYEKPQPKNWNFLTKYNGSRGGLDFFATAYYGTSVFGALKNTNTADQYRLVHPKALQLTAGISKVIANHRAYGEMLYQHTLHNEDDRFYQVLGGFFSRYTGSVPNFLKLDEINTTIEIGHDEIVRSQRDTEFYSSSYPLRRNMNTITGQVVLVVQPGLSAYFGKSHNYSDKGQANFIGTQVYLSETFFLQLTYTHFKGDEVSSAFGHMHKNNNTLLSFNWRF